MWMTLCQNWYPHSFQPRSLVSVPGTLLKKGFLFFFILLLLPSDLPSAVCVSIHLTASERYFVTDVSKNFLTNLIETTSAKFSWFSSVKLNIGTTSPSIHLEAGRFNFNRWRSPFLPSSSSISVSISVPRRPQIWAWYSLHCIAHSCFWHLIYPLFLLMSSKSLKKT